MRPGTTASDTALGSRAVALLVVAAAAVGAYFWFGHRVTEPPAPEPEAAISAPAVIKPVIEHPVEVPSAVPLPALNESDPTVSSELAGLVGAERFAALFSTDGIVQRFVATVDNLPRAKVAARHRPVKPLSDGFLADGTDGEIITLSASNYARYVPYVQLIDSLDPDRVAAVYARLYPLFQKAYEDLGYPGGYFNDRLVEAIDNLLAAPDLPGPVELVRPNVVYEFADPLLEARSAGQKLMMRIGPQNAARVKAQLRELRRRIAGQAP
jgi:hypothetical protein